jgi:hypothetical protein
MELPSFFKDNSNSDKFEEIIDFFLSWTLRCADYRYSIEHKSIQRQALKILSTLLFENSNELNNRIVSEVKVWKQEDHVDLWVELKIDDELHAIIIENKMYSSIRQNQLENYKKNAEDYYGNQGRKIQLHFVFIRPDYGTDDEIKRINELEFVKNQDYRHKNLDEIIEEIEDDGLTGNYMFDAFWHKSW